MDIRKQIQNIQQSALTDPRFKHNEEVTITADDAAYVNKLFNSLLPQFPAWRQTCPTDNDLERLKMAWTKAIMRNHQKTGKNLNIKTGLIACEESESDWLPSVGKFIKWCNASTGVLPLAQRALDLFNSSQKQVDSVGKIVTAKHAFDLKRMTADQSNKRFIELYLNYAENNEIKALDAFALPESVQLSPEQQKASDKRKQDAQNEFFKQFDKFIDKNPNIPPEVAKKALEKHHGIKQGSLKKYAKTPAQIQAEKERQLKLAKGMMK